MHTSLHAYGLGLALLASACNSTGTLTWQQQLEEARAMQARGEAYVLVKPSEVLVFYNEPQPFAYMYRIPGQWLSLGGNQYQSKDKRTTVLVQFGLPEHVSGLEGITLVERARSHVTRDYEKALGRPINAALSPFSSERAGTWKWTASPVEQGSDSRIVFPTKVIVDLSPVGFALITVSDASGGAATEDRLARDIIASLRTTSNPEGYSSILEGALRSSSPTDG